MQISPIVYDRHDILKKGEIVVFWQSCCAKYEAENLLVTYVSKGAQLCIDTTLPSAKINTLS